MEIYLRYVGASAIDGVPARDLTQEEAEQFGVERLIGSGLYVRVQAKMRGPAPENKMFRPRAEDKEGKR